MTTTAEFSRSSTSTSEAVALMGTTAAAAAPTWEVAIQPYIAPIAICDQAVCMYHLGSAFEGDALSGVGLCGRTHRLPPEGPKAVTPRRLGAGTGAPPSPSSAPKRRGLPSRAQRATLSKCAGPRSRGRPRGRLQARPDHFGPAIPRRTRVSRAWTNDRERRGHGRGTARVVQRDAHTPSAETLIGVRGVWVAPVAQEDAYLDPGSGLVSILLPE